MVPAELARTQDIPVIGVSELGFLNPLTVTWKLLNEELAESVITIVLELTVQAVTVIVEIP